MKGHAMEYVRVTYPTDRLVYINGEKGGFTNDVLRVAAGTHEFTLGNLRNYEPESQEIEVDKTTVLKPLEIVFTKKAS
jgi:hypothetical protein